MEQYRRLLIQCNELWTTLPPSSRVVEAVPYGSGGMNAARVTVILPDQTSKYYFIKVQQAIIEGSR